VAAGQVISAMQYLFDVCAVSWLHLGRIFWSQVALAHKTICIYQYAMRDVYKMSLAFGVFSSCCSIYVYRILIVGIVTLIVQLMLTLENTTEVLQRQVWLIPIVCR